MIKFESLKLLYPKPEAKDPGLLPAVMFALLLVSALAILAAIPSLQEKHDKVALAKCDAVSVEQKRALNFIASHWRVPQAHADEVVKVAYQAAALYNLDPVMLLAMAGKESSFRHLGNPGGGNNPNKPFGIMQVDGRWHPEKFKYGKAYVTTVDENIFIGARIVREYLDREKGDARFALMRYNGTRWQDDRYYRGVASIQTQLATAMADSRWDA